MTIERVCVERKGLAMPVTTKIKESKVYYAASGARDLAVEKLREVPQLFTGLQERADAKDLGGAAVAYVSHVGAKAAEIFDELAERGRKHSETEESTPELPKGTSETPAE
jgi:hypothetical protein